MHTHETVKLAYSISEACHAIGIGRSKLYELIGDGHVKTIKVGSRTLIPADSLRALVSGSQGKV